MLVVDFRTVEDWIVERVTTSHHHERLPSLDRSIATDASAFVMILIVIEVYLTTA